MGPEEAKKLPPSHPSPEGFRSTWHLSWHPVRAPQTLGLFPCDPQPWWVISLEGDYQNAFQDLSTAGYEGIHSRATVISLEGGVPGVGGQVCFLMPHMEPGNLLPSLSPASWLCHEERRRKLQPGLGTKTRRQNCCAPSPLRPPAHSPRLKRPPRSTSRNSWPACHSQLGFGGSERKRGDTAY